MLVLVILFGVILWLILKDIWKVFRIIGIVFIVSGILIILVGFIMKYVIVGANFGINLSKVSNFVMKRFVRDSLVMILFGVIELICVNVIKNIK